MRMEKGHITKKTGKMEVERRVQIGIFWEHLERSSSKVELQAQDRSS